MPVGVPNRVTREFERRSEPVRVTVVLDRGAIEDLEVLCRHRHGGTVSRSWVVRRAVGMLLAREAEQVIRGREVDRRRERRLAEERRAVRLARAATDQRAVAVTRKKALAIAHGVGVSRTAA